MITSFVLLLLIQFFVFQEQAAPPVEVLEVEVLAQEFKPRRVPDPRSAPPPPGPVSRDDLTGRRTETSRTGQPTIERRSSELNKIGGPVPPPPPPRVRQTTSAFLYEYRVKVKNTTPKKIKAIIWEYQLTDESGDTVFSQKLFRCAGNVKPGDIKVLRSSTSSPPTQVVNADTSYKQKAVVYQVEYNDGSTWTRDGWKQDDSPETRGSYCTVVSP